MLPSGTAIDLRYSRLPSAWGSLGNYSQQIDLLFSPRGMLTQESSAFGSIHFLLTDMRNIDAGRAPVRITSVTTAGINEQTDGTEDPTNVGEHLIVSITTQSGKITTHSVNVSASPLPTHNYYDFGNVNNYVFRNAESGQEAR